MDEKSESHDMNDTKEDDGVEDDIMMHLSTDDVMSLQKVFLDQELTLEEFVAALRKRLSSRIKDPVQFIAACIELFETVDVNGDNAMEWDEFSQFMQQAGMVRMNTVAKLVSREKRYIRLVPTKCEFHKFHPTQSYIQQMIYVQKLGAILFFETQSDTVQCYSYVEENDSQNNNPVVVDPRFPTYRQMPRMKSHLLHHTRYVSHKVSCIYYVESRDILVTSSSITLNQAYLSFWDITTLSTPVLRRQMEISAVQTSIVWIAYSKLLVTGPDLPPANSLLARSIHVWDIFHYSLVTQLSGLHVGKITFLLTLNLNMKGYLVSGASDGLVCVYDITEKDLRFQITAHQYGVRSMALSQTYTFVVTVGEGEKDQNTICVWKMNEEVKGAEKVHSLSSRHRVIQTAVVDCESQIVSADIHAVFSIWQYRYHRVTKSSSCDCVQQFSVHGSSFPLKHLTFLVRPTEVSKHSVTILAAPSTSDDVQLYRYHDVYEAEKIVLCTYCETYNRIIGVSDLFVRQWDALTGVLLHVYKETREFVLTAACLDDRGRKLLLGNSSGSIRVSNLINDAFMKELDPFEAEVSFLQYINGTKFVLAASIRNEIRIYDENNALGYYEPIIGDPKSVTIRSITFEPPTALRRHRKSITSATSFMNTLGVHNVSGIAQLSEIEVTTACVSRVLNIVATLTLAGPGESYIHTWDFRSFVFISLCTVASPVEIQCITILEPYPALAAGTTDGRILIWGLRGCVLKYQCVAELRLSTTSSSICSMTCNREKELSLFASNSAGVIGCWKFPIGIWEDWLGKIDYRKCGAQSESKLLSSLSSSNNRRTQTTFSWKNLIDARRKAEKERNTTTSRNTAVKKTLPPSFTWKGHADVVSTMEVTESPASLVTSSADGTIGTWRLEDGADLGTLHLNEHSKKGMMLASSGKWKYPVDMQRRQRGKVERAKEVMQSLGWVSRKKTSQGGRRGGGTKRLSHLERILPLFKSEEELEEIQRRRSEFAHYSVQSERSETFLTSVVDDGMSEELIKQRRRTSVLSQLHSMDEEEIQETVEEQNGGEVVRSDIELLKALNSDDLIVRSTAHHASDDNRGHVHHHHTMSSHHPLQRRMSHQQLSSIESHLKKTAKLDIESREKFNNNALDAGVHHPFKLSRRSSIQTINRHFGRFDDGTSILSNDRKKEISSKPTRARHRSVILDNRSKANE